MNWTYMLDTPFCAFIMRKQPETMLERLEQAMLGGHRIVISAVTWAELSQPHGRRVLRSLHAVLPWDRAAMDAITQIKTVLATTGTPLGPNDVVIAGHAISASAALVTRNGGVGAGTNSRRLGKVI